MKKLKDHPNAEDLANAKKIRQKHNSVKIDILNSKTFLSYLKYKYINFLKMIC
jgi:hypothetical protein